MRLSNIKRPRDRDTGRGAALGWSCGPESGIALIIVMISIVVLAIMAAGLAFSMKVETRLAYNANSEAEITWLGRSGIEYARWILAQQDLPQVRALEPYDALNQVWAGGSGGLGTSNSPLADVQHEVNLGNGSFTWKITDLERKWNINTAIQPGGQEILQNALMQMGVDAGDQTPIVNSILNWIDNGRRAEGADDSYYQGLNPPYDVKNGPIDDLSELLLIRGISQEMYWGSSEAHPIGRFQQNLNPFGGQPQAPTYTVGFVNLFVPMSSGQININTASAEVLQLIPGVDPTIAQAIVAGRDGEDDRSGLIGPYRDPGQLRRIPEIPVPLIPRIAQYCTVRSTTFKVEVDAHVGQYTRHFSAILVRNNPRDVQVLNFSWTE